MTQKQKNYAIPLAFVGMMFFSLGFALGINSFLIPVLKDSLSLPSGVAYLLLAATFVPFLIFGYPASKTIAAIGYKRTMALSFLIFAAAFVLFVLSAKQESFPLFLIASFVSGAANAYLQACVNPYVTILGPLESAAKRISIMGICNKLAWPVAPLFFSLIVADPANVGIEDLTFVGHAVDDFEHHRSWVDDGAYKPVNFMRLVNSWMRRVDFKDVSEAASIISSANVSAYDINILGNRGHAAIRSQGSSRVFIGKVTDRTKGPLADNLSTVEDEAGQYHA